MPASAAAGMLDVLWIAPTTNTDGSPLMDLESYRVYYGTSGTPCPGSSFFQVLSSTSSPPANYPVTFRLTGLSAGTSYTVAVTALNSSGAESACSDSASGVARIHFGVSPTATVDFDDVNLGGFADRTFTVSNTGGGTVSGAASTSGPFRIVAGSPFSLVGLGASQAVTVRFTPIAVALATSNVTFTADGETISRLVRGTGIPADATPPTVAITSPTSEATYTTSSSLLTLEGTASDDVGVTLVTWRTAGATTGRRSGRRTGRSWGSSSSPGRTC